MQYQLDYVIACLISFLFITACESGEEGCLNVEYLQKENSESTEIILAMNDYLDIQLRYDLADVSKIKYRSVVVMKEKVREHIKSAVTRMENSKNEDLEKESLENEIRLELQHIDEELAVFFETNGSTFGMRDSDITERKAYIHKLTEWDFIYPLFSKESCRDFYYSMLRNKIAKTEHLLLTQLFLTTGSRVMEPYHYYPVVIPEKAVVKKGAFFKADIQIGLYIIPKMLPENIRIYVNNLQQEVDESGKVLFSELADSTGERILHLKYEIDDPLNHEMEDGYSTFR